MEKKEAVPLGDAIGGVLRSIGFRKRKSLSELEDIWRECVGCEASRHTRVGGFRAGVLTIEVDSSARLQELSNFYRDEILEKLREKSKKLHIAGLKFKLAHWETNHNGESS